jgi:hypothetical protein
MLSNIRTHTWLIRCFALSLQRSVKSLVPTMHSPGQKQNVKKEDFTKKKKKKKKLIEKI